MRLWSRDGLEVYGTHLGLENIFRGFDPFDGESEFFDGVDERSDIAGDMIKQMHRRHCTLMVLRRLQWFPFHLFSFKVTRYIVSEVTSMIVASSGPNESQISRLGRYDLSALHKVIILCISAFSWLWIWNSVVAIARNIINYFSVLLISTRWHHQMETIQSEEDYVIRPACLAFYILQPCASINLQFYHIDDLISCSVL